MSASIPIPFAIGDELWWATINTRKEREVCPDCLGTCTVALVLANGSTHVLGCGNCDWGMEGPHGWVQRSESCFEPQPFIPRRVWMSGEDIYYSEAAPDATCYTSANVKDLFASREECEAACVQRNAERRAEEEKRFFAATNRKRQDKANSVSYWRREAERLRKDLARVEAYLAEQPREVKP